MENKIGIMLENRFLDKEILYYTTRFQEEGLEVEYLSRLWGQEKLTFEGMELKLKLDVSKSFEHISDEELKDYKAIIMPAGYVADYLLYSEVPGDVSPAAKFIERIMKNKDIVKGFICHALWIAGPISHCFKDRKLVCHNNIISHLQNAGAIYVDKDICIDDDVVTARQGGLYGAFAKTIIDQIKGRG